jgi:hypothetical protein
LPLVLNGELQIAAEFGGYSRVPLEIVTFPDDGREAPHFSSDVYGEYTHCNVRV